MKLTFIITCFITVKLFSQIPNQSFENWTTFVGYQDPTDWTSINATIAITGTASCLKLSPGFVGSYYVSLLTATIMPSGTWPGFMSTGVVVPGSYKGYPFTGRPSSLNGEWQYKAPTLGSNCSIVVYLTKWNAAFSKRDTVCYQSTILSGTVSAWTSFSINLTPGYKTWVNPDSCIISMRSNLLSSVSVGDYLNIDDLSFNGIVTQVGEFKNNSDFNMFPNPANERLNFNFPELVRQKEITISDGLGREIIRSLENNIDVSSLEKGIYFVRVNVNDKISYKRIIKN